MMIQMMYELNNTYMIVRGKEIEKTEDFRYKMLSANSISGILPLEIRQINGEKKIYIDVTGKENLLNYFNCHVADRKEIRKLFDAIYLISVEMAKFLIEETDVILRPEMVFKNLSTDEYEFVCIPLIEEGMTLNEGMRTLLHFLMAHLDNNDEQLVDAIYSISDMFEKTKPKFTLIYDFFLEKTREEEIEKTLEPEEEKEEELVKKQQPYIPGFREIAALAMCLVGIVMLGYNFYLSML